MKKFLKLVAKIYLVSFAMSLLNIFYPLRVLAATLKVGEDNIFSECSWHESSGEVVLADDNDRPIDIDTGSWAQAQFSSVGNTVSVTATVTPPPAIVYLGSGLNVTVGSIYAGAVADAGMEFKLDLNGYNWADVQNKTIRVTTDFSYQFEVEGSGLGLSRSEGNVAGAHFWIQGVSGSYNAIKEIDSCQEYSNNRQFIGNASSVRVLCLSDIYYPEAEIGWLDSAPVNVMAVTGPQGYNATAQSAIARITINSVKVEFSKEQPTLEILDGVDFTSGREVSSDPKRLASGGIPVEGAVTDGVTRLLLRLIVDKPQAVIFSLQGTDNSSEDGILRSIGGSQEGSSVTVNTVEVNGKEYAFAVYQAPEDFVRSSAEQEDKGVSERSMPIKVEFNSPPAIEQKIRLVRPPLILVHGIWSGPEMWNNFRLRLQNEISGLQVYTVDYKEKNSSYFAENKDVPYSCKGDSIEKVKEKFNSEKIAMVQADILGHSMGGLLARIYAAGDNLYYKGFYANDRNFFMGDINKLITLDSPHYGAFLADLAIQCIRGPDSIVKDWLLAILKLNGYILNRGAIYDLMTTDYSIKNMNQINIITPSHTIAGDYLVLRGNLKFIPGDLGTLLRTLKRLRCDPSPYVISNRSDLVCSVDSQFGGIDLPASYVFAHQHLETTSEGVANHMVELLNAGEDRILFKKGFPVNKN